VRSIVGVLKSSAADVARRESVHTWNPADPATFPVLQSATPTRCQLHPQAYRWESATGPRCAICATLLDGTQPPREPPQTRNLDTFQTEAARVTGGWQNGLQLDPDTARLLKAACVMASEAGEVMNEVQRVVFCGWPLDDEMRRKLILELGDVQWGVAEAASALRVSLSEVATENTRKLERRYPSGWSSEASMAGRKL
jgi:NTP pyrophosphatase (non-canonical NTP hydrolase)